MGINGRALEGDVLAHTPWGEIAHALGGKAGYERVRRSDEDRVAPGAAGDAYTEEHRFVADRMAEIESVSPARRRC